MKVWLVIEDGACEGETSTKTDVFDSQEKAKEFLQKRVAEIKESDYLYEEYKEQVEDGEDECSVCVEEHESSFAMYLNGWYEENHIELHIEEKEVK